MVEPLLHARFQHRQGALSLDVDFMLHADWTCLFGASGSGKTTILRVLNGLTRPQAGSVVLAGTVLLDTATGVWVPPHRRPVRTAAQSAWLLPGGWFRLGTVRSNVAYGMAPDMAAALPGVLERFRLAPDTPVTSLSGGERQRVSLARAVAAALYGPQRAGLLLLDEPFAGFDLLLRDTIAAYLREWLAAEGLPVLSVTHDVAEACLLRSQVLRVDAGRIVGDAPAAEALAPERTRLLSHLGLDAPGHP